MLEPPLVSCSLAPSPSVFLSLFLYLSPSLPPNPSRSIRPSQSPALPVPPLLLALSRSFHLSLSLSLSATRSHPSLLSHRAPHIFLRARPPPFSLSAEHCWTCRDMTRKCKECNATYVIVKSEVHFFLSRSLSLPARCSSCRAQARISRNQGAAVPDSHVSDRDVPLPAIPIESEPATRGPMTSQTSSAVCERQEEAQIDRGRCVPFPRDAVQIQTRRVGWIEEQASRVQGAASSSPRVFRPVAAAFSQSKGEVARSVDAGREWKKRKT